MVGFWGLRVLGSKSWGLRFCALAGTLIAFALTGSSAAADSNLVGQWHFNEGQGTTAGDSSGNGNNGTLLGSPPPAWVAGRFGTALSFNGGNVVQVTSPSSSIEPSSVSVTAWVNDAHSPGDFRYIVAKGASGCDSASYGLYSGPDGGLAFYVSDGTAGTSHDYILSPDPGTRVWDGSWHLVVGTFNGSTLRLYIDGSEVGSGTAFAGQIAYSRTNSTDLFIGNYLEQTPPCAAGGFNGVIDEVTVWNGALSAAQVSALEPTSGSTAPEGSTAPGTGTTFSGPGVGPTGVGPNGTTGGQAGKGTNHTNLPALSRLRVSPATVAKASSKNHAKHPTPVMISYTDSQAAFSTFYVVTSEPGVMKHARCVKLLKGKSAGKAKRCTIYVVVGHFTHADHAGANRFAFTALSRLKLASGRYWLDATPSTHGERGRTVSTSFKVAG